MTHRRQAKRPAFTLVELLVVIAIIGILMSLLLAAVTKTLTRIEETQTRNDISQMSQAISAFTTHYGVEIPSRIFLAPRKSMYTGTRLRTESFAYLQRLFGSRFQWNDASGAETTHDWGAGPNNAVILEGHQCLVFFVGGPPVGPNRTPAGFSTNPAFPDAPPTGTDTRFKAFDFPTNKLVQARTWKLTGTTWARDATLTFPAFLDGYKKVPYAFFSSYKTENGYNRFLTDEPVLGKSDCDDLQQVWPYAESPFGPFPALKYLNPSGYQIVSAGRDKMFGHGTFDTGHIWNPLNPSGNMEYQGSNVGADDMSNFSPVFLGIPVK